MTRRRPRGLLIVAGTVGVFAIAVAVGARLWGREGLEAASWVAGIASLVVALVTLYVTRPGAQGGSGSGPVTNFRMRARAGGNARITQIGRQDKD